MVVLNLTLLVQLGLFLVFLYVMNAVILRPTLQELDARDNTIERDEQSAQIDASDAEQLEKKHVVELGGIRREAAVQTAQGVRTAQEKHMAALAEQRKQSDADVAAVRDKALMMVDGERAQYGALAPEVAKAIAKCLGVGGDAS